LSWKLYKQIKGKCFTSRQNKGEKIIFNSLYFWINGIGMSNYFWLFIRYFPSKKVKKFICLTFMNFFRSSCRIKAELDHPQSVMSNKKYCKNDEHELETLFSIDCWKQPSKIYFHNWFENVFLFKFHFQILQSKLKPFIILSWKLRELDSFWNRPIDSKESS